MSIDANVVDIKPLHDGNAKLILHQPDKERTAGQNALTVLNPPENLAKLLNKAIWGGSDILMCGEIEIGRRAGYTCCTINKEALEKI